MYSRNGAFQPQSFAAIASWLLLQAPAIWNGFPLLQYDTGGYLARWYEGTLVPSRTVTYGLMLNVAAPAAFWPVVAVQAGLAVWLIVLVLRAQGFGGRPWLLLLVVAVLTLISTLPWLTSILLTDIFAGLGVLALYLLLLRPDSLTRRERFALIALVAVSAATHTATIAVLLVLTLASVLLWAVRPRRMPLTRIGNGVLALAFGALFVLAANLVVAKQFAWTPGGFALSFGRMLQDGIVKKYLDDHCPDPKRILCAHKDQLPDDADVWFWGSQLFDKLGRFQGLGAEMQAIVLNSLFEYPGLQAKAAGAATIKQLIAVHTGEGVVNTVWHTYRIIEQYTPRLVPFMRMAHQQKDEISFTVINSLQYPVALIAMALLPIIVLVAYRRKMPDVGELAATCGLAIVANAFICGTLSNPHDRYGARLVWIAVFTSIIALLRLASRLGSRHHIA
ncbi:MAG TPA: hypothetical protein VLU23_05095 [Pseudolabrys sp.]|nr:hypothetical protein [Pseudolabrys sp.]